MADSNWGTPESAGDDPPNDGQYNSEPAQEPGATDVPAAYVHSCPSCGHEFTLDTIPEGGLLTCPSCGGEFFAVTQMSEEDRAEAERLELDRQVRDERLSDLRHNAVLIERRSLFRTRTYLILGLVVSFAIVLQLSVYIAERLSSGGFTLRVGAYLTAIVALAALGVLCFVKVRQLNAELARPVQRDPVKPPDFTTLSDGSQYLDVVAGNLEKLSKKS